MKKVQQTLFMIKDWEAAAHSDTTLTTITDLVFELRHLEIPGARFNFEYAGYAGAAENGDSWEDIGWNMVMLWMYPQSIQAKQHSTVTSLMTVYCFKDGKRADISREHGGDTGKATDKFTFAPDECVNFVGSWDTLSGAG